MMKLFIEYDTFTGEVLKAMVHTAEGASKSIGETSALYEVTKEAFEVASRAPCYFQGGSIYELPPKPKKGFAFNYVTKEWVDERSLEEVRESKWEQLKEERDALEFGGFVYEGDVYDSDQMSQGRILAAASLGVSMEWTLANNQRKVLQAEDLSMLVLALSTHIAEVHTKGRIARDAIYSLNNFEEIEAVVL